MGEQLANVRRIACEITGFILLVLLDQWTKILSVVHLKGQSPFVLIDGVLEFYYLENHGAAFSLLQDATVFFFIVAIVAMAAIALILHRMPRTRAFLLPRIFLVCIAAGALGNLIDRMTLGYVRDFIYFSLINFPVFNVADIYVTVSVALLVVLMLFVYKEEDLAWMSNSPKVAPDNHHE